MRRRERPDLSNDVASGFILDSDELQRHRHASFRRLHSVQMPAMRLGGFLILCLISILHDARHDAAFPSPSLIALCAANVAYALGSWWLLWRLYEPGRRPDWSLVCLHTDVLMWLWTLQHVEANQPFFAFLLLVRVGDQMGFGFRRAVYFNHLVVGLYLLYSFALPDGLVAPLADSERWSMAAIMYLIGNYIAVTGLVIERLRARSRTAVRTARALVERLERQTTELRQQADELHSARTQAEQASLAKSQFLAMISHEIRTPMNGILGATELLQSSELPEPQRRLARTAHSSSTALLAIIDDVLDISRIEAGKLDLHPARFNLHRLVDDVIDLMSASAQQKALELSCHLGTTVPQRLYGDGVRLRQLLMNLVGNAVKFTSRGRVWLVVRLLDEAEEHVRLRFEVHDTGIGIPAAMLEHIFDPFTQADASTTRRYGGSGLGLAIVRQFAGLMGGSVGVESTPNIGSTFWLELPFERAEDEAGSSTQAAPLPATGGRVLLAEDNLVNQLVLSEMLERLGCSVEVAADGRSALDAHAAAAAGAYDLILMDCHMPVMDGFEASRQIRLREAGSGRHTPIVALTAAVLPEDREQCLAAGMDDFLSKPVTLEMLSQAVARWSQAGLEAA